MRKPQFSIRFMLAVVAFMALACAALAKPNIYSTLILSFITPLLLCLAPVAGAMLRGVRQAFWIGFATAGIAWYLYIWSDLSHIFLGEDMVEWFAKRLYDPFAPGPRTDVFFIFSGRNITAIVVGLIGGILGRYCYASRETQGTDELC